MPGCGVYVLCTRNFEEQYYAHMFKPIFHGELVLNIKSLFPGLPEGHFTLFQSPCLSDPGVQEVMPGVRMKPRSDLQG